MPIWKLQYDSTARWQLVRYIRSIFTQTQPRPPQPETPEGDFAFVFPQSYKGRTWPPGTSYDGGKSAYIRYCAGCHGVAGDGTGWDGAYLHPVPANLHDQLTETNPPDELMAKLSYGIEDTAMPPWLEWMPFNQRWALVKYIVDTFQKGVPGGQSLFDPNTLPAQYVTYDNGIYEEEGNKISVSNGKTIFMRFCSSCHGANGAGNGPGLKDLASDGPAPFPSNMPDAYVFWRAHDGITGTIMPAFQRVQEHSFFNATFLPEGSQFLGEADLRDVAAYLASKK